VELLLFKGHLRDCDRMSVLHSLISVNHSHRNATRSVVPAVLDSATDSFALFLVQSHFRMTPSTKANLAAYSRDLRLDIVLGIANWSILLDHIPNNVVSLLTPRNFGFSGAADLFFFTAGYAAAMLYGKMAVERGLLVAVTRIFKRVWQVYAAYVVLFVIYIDLIGSVAAQYAAPDIIDEYRVIGIVDDPTRTLLDGLLLKAIPLNLDGLQLFIVLMGAFPPVFAALLRWPNLTMAGSLVLYFAARQFDLHPWTVAEGQWFFNPFCWQVLFVFGAWLALEGTRRMRALQEIAVLRQLALAYLLFALLMAMAAKMPLLGTLLPDVVVSPFTQDGRENLSPYRVLHLLALVFIASRWVPPDWAGLRSSAMQPLLKCGVEWLPCFCVGVFLSFAGHFVLITNSNSLSVQVLVSVASVAMMTTVAYYVSWSRKQDHMPTRAAETATIALKQWPRDIVGRTPQTEPSHH